MYSMLPTVTPWQMYTQPECIPWQTSTTFHYSTTKYNTCNFVPVGTLIVDLILRLSVLVHQENTEYKELAMFVATTVPWDHLAKYSRVKKSQGMLPIPLVQNQEHYQEWHHELNAIWHDWDLGYLKPSARCTTGALTTSIPQYSYIS